MADIRREIGDTSPNNFVRQGVVDNSTAMAIEGLGEAGLALDRRMAMNEVSRNSEGLYDVYRENTPAGAPSSVLGEAQGQGELSPSDKAEVSSLASAAARRQAGVDQGRMTYDIYRLQVERMLRMAIARRPGLAADFRQAVAADLGAAGAEYNLDAGAYADEMAAMSAEEKAAQAEREAAEKATERMRKIMTDSFIEHEQIVDDSLIPAFYRSQLDNIEDRLALKRSQEFASDRASVITETQTFDERGATAAYVEKGRQYRAALSDAAGRVMPKLIDPETTAEERLQLMAGLREAAKSQMSAMAEFAAGTKINDVVQTTEMNALQELLDLAEKYPTQSATDQTATITRMETIQQYELLRDNPTLQTLQTLSKAYDGDPAIMATFMRPGGGIDKVAAAAANAALVGDMSRPANAIAAAPQAVNNFMISADKGKVPSPLVVASHVKVLKSTLTAFVVTPDSEFKQDSWNGRVSFLSNMDLGKADMKRLLSPTEQGEIVAGMAAAAFNSQRLLHASLLSRSPGLRGKIVASINPETGTLFTVRDGATVTEQEQELVRQYNSTWNGPQLLGLIKYFTEKDGKQATKLIYGAEKLYNDQRNKVKPKQAVVPSSGGVPRPTTQAAFNALKVGEEYIDPDDGKRYYKAAP